MKKVYTISIILLIVVFVYLLINSAILLWISINPMGFWPIFLFYAIASISLVLFVQLLAFFLTFLSKSARKEFGIAGFALFLIIILFGALAEFAPTLFFTKIMADRYRYIEVSEKHIDRGRYEKALNYAEKLYAKEGNRINKPPGPWILVNRFKKSEKGIQTFNNREYQAKINYAFCTELLGNDFDKADSLYLQCINLADQYFKGQGEYEIIPILGRFRVSLSTGDLLNTEKHYSHLLQISDAFSSKDIFSITSLAFNYSMHIERLGDIQKAQEIRSHALGMFNNSEKSKESTYYLNILIQVIFDELQNKKLVEVDKHLRIAKKIAKKRHKQIIYIDYLNAKAKYESLVSNDDAERLYKEALRRSKRKSNVIRAEQYSQLGKFYFSQKKYQLAINNLWKSNKTSSKSAYDIFTPEEYLGIILSNFALGNNLFAKSNMLDFDQGIKDQANQNFILLNSSEKNKFSERIDRYLRLSNSLYIALNDSTLNSNIFDNTLATKSISMLSHQYLELQLNNAEETKIRDRYNTIKKQKEVLNTQALLSIKNSLVLKQLETLRIEERKIIESIVSKPGFIPFDISEISWKEVRNSLKSNEAAIEIIHVPISPYEESDNFYYALIIKPEYHNPKLVPLCNEADLIKIIGNSFTAEQINELYSGESIDALYQNIWEPIKPYLGNVDVAYISLSGLLHKISYSALLIDEPINIKILSNTRLLAKKLYDSTSVVKNAVLFGDINYEKLATADTASSDNSPDFALYRSIDKYKFNHLPGSLFEINAVSKILAEQHVDTLLITGSRASEASFRKISDGDLKIIHIASHAFYYPEESSIIVKNTIFSKRDDYTKISNPMQRSGILFAGASFPKKESFNNDGILTSYEIANLDLTNVKLAVLSACETGLGDVIGSEGVFGLQRAFKMAGAEKLIMSLWKVPDTQTSELIVAFYKYYTTGKSEQEALRKAQLEMRDKYKDPYYWAAFIVVE